ncbi:hypothetical protein L210DRAFT_857917 [Boletus edulis BED1]|uniref:Fungal-type protein kinase domain-containing protein n=1 Tax=Boletus edulis BED1 TaxID=1328754 RepID=A0AAD4GEJ0_BOLED|nr:hypothetical protein L210DRAFT_857917 [Boletus edulis BED1]
MMKIVSGIRGVPSLVEYMVVDLGGTGHTCTYCFQNVESVKPLHCLHLRLVFEPYAMPMQLFKTKKELLTCFRDLVCKTFNRHVIHYNSSLNNVMSVADANGILGLLIDWEFSAQIMADDRYTIAGMRTLPFMSINILEQITPYASEEPSKRRKLATSSKIPLSDVKIKQTWHNDLESLFYVLVYLYIKFKGPMGLQHKIPDTTLPMQWSADASTPPYQSRIR